MFQLMMMDQDDLLLQEPGQRRQWKVIWLTLSDRSLSRVFIKLTATLGCQMGVWDYLRNQITHASCLHVQPGFSYHFHKSMLLAECLTP